MDLEILEEISDEYKMNIYNASNNFESLLDIDICYEWRWLFIEHSFYPILKADIGDGYSFLLAFLTKNEYSDYIDFCAEIDEDPSTRFDLLTRYYNFVVKRTAINASGPRKKSLEFFQKIIKNKKILNKYGDNLYVVHFTDRNDLLLTNEPVYVSGSNSKLLIE